MFSFKIGIDKTKGMHQAPIGTTYEAPNIYIGVEYPI